MEKLEDAVSGRKEINAEVLEELEYALITADIGSKTTAEILERIRERFRNIPGGVDLADELIAERRAEAKRENELE